MNTIRLILSIVSLILGLNTFGATSPKNNNFFQSLRTQPLDGGLAAEVEALTHTAPATVGPTVSVHGGLVATESGKALHSVGGPAVNITVVPILAPALGSKWEPIIEAEADVMAGKIGLHKSYQPITGPVPWRNWIQNRVGETGWHVIICIVKLESGDGSDSVNLSMLRLNADSGGGGLDASYRIAGAGYSATAFGLTSNGSLVTSGHQDTMVAKLCLAVQFPLFEGDTTKPTEGLIRNWILSSHLMVHYSVTAEGRSGAGHAMVEADMPRLVMNTEGIEFLGDEPGYAFDLYRAPGPAGPWRPFDTIFPGDKIPLDKVVDKRATAWFFRASGR